jgi:hypothetical protein
MHVKAALAELNGDPFASLITTGGTSNIDQVTIADSTTWAGPYSVGISHEINASKLIINIPTIIHRRGINWLTLFLSTAQPQLSRSSCVL